MAADLIVDPKIRIWVFLPIVVITFLVGILRHHVSVLLTSQKKLNVRLTRDSQIMLRAKLLRENAKYIPKSAFLIRKNAFNKEEDGYFTEWRPSVTPNIMTDPGFMLDILKGNLTNVLPMIVIGGWINWTFSGFITTKVPFPLTLRFKSMLQRGIELTHLDASWVSSVSWYFLNVFGLRSIYTLILGEDNEADNSKQIEEQMSGNMPNDAKAAIRSEWEALEIVEHRWALENIEKSFIRKCKKKF